MADRIYPCCGHGYCRCGKVDDGERRRRAAKAGRLGFRSHESAQESREQFALGEAARAMGQWPRNA